jgi:hypothetical protein
VSHVAVQFSYEVAGHLLGMGPRYRIVGARCQGQSAQRR